MLKKSNTAWISVILCCSLYSAHTFADAHYDHIKQEVKDFVSQQINVENNDKVEVDILDNNTPQQFASCSSPLQYSVPNNAHSEQINSVEINCLNENWHRYLPVEVKIMTKVVIAKRNIVAAQMINADDLDYAEHNKNRLYSGYFTNPQEVIGNVPARSLVAGSILTPKNIHPPAIIHKNQTITLEARRNFISVVMQGVAKSDGALNGVIKVYNPSSRKTIDAIVIDNNRALVVSSS